MDKTLKKIKTLYRMYCLAQEIVDGNLQEALLKAIIQEFEEADNDTLMYLAAVLPVFE